MRHANAYTNGDSNGYAYTDSYANCNGNGYAHTDSYANGDSNGYAHTDSYGNCYSNGDCDRTAAAFTDGAASTDTAAAPVGSGTSYPLTRELANDPASSPCCSPPRCDISLSPVLCRHVCLILNRLRNIKVAVGLLNHNILMCA